MGKVEILILSNGVWTPLEVRQDAIGFGLQFSIDDVRTPEKRNSSYSKTIKLVGSKKNNMLMGHLYDVHSDFSYFNPNNKSKARILIDSTTVLDGFLQLKSIDKLSNVDQQGNKIEYNVVVFDDNIDFFSELGEKKLEDLDVSQYNHIYGRENIMSSWTNQWSAGYTYPMLENGNIKQTLLGYVTQTDYKTEDFKPAFYHKWLLNKCAEESGFILSGSFMDNEVYKKEIIPFNGDVYPLRPEDLLSRTYDAGLTVDKIMSNSIIGAYQIDAQLYTNFNDDFTLPYFDTTASFTYDNNLAVVPPHMVDDLYSKWTVNKAGEYSFKTKMKISVTFTPTQNGTLKIAQNSADLNAGTGIVGDMNLQISLNEEWIGGTTAVINSSLSDLVAFPASTTTGVPFTLDFLIDIETNNVDLIQNDILRQFIQIDTVPVTSGYDYFGYDYGGGTVDLMTTTVTINKVYGIGEESNTLNIALSGEITDGDQVNIWNSLPKNFKQKDLFIDIIRRYNVYISIDPDDNRKLILDSRDDYYTNADILDWSKKKDYSSPDNIKFLTELQNKEVLFTYKNDTSAQINNGRKVLDEYTKRTGDIYGQHTIEYNNDFISGSKKIESPFSPSMILYQSQTGTFVSAINAMKPKSKPRVVLYNGLVNCENAKTWKFRRNNGGTIEFYDHTTYPQAIHYDDAILPDVDINFGQSPYEEYSQIERSTDNNLYNNYWRNFVEQVDDGKMITSYFELNEYDINKIRNKFNYKILIENGGVASYYFINKVIDYNPIRSSLTKVELLKIKDGVVFEKSTGTTLIDASLPVTRGLDVAGNAGNNVVNNPLTILNGTSNRVNTTESAIINGSNNIVADGSKSIYVGGDNNYVPPGVDNVIIMGDNITAIESNVAYIGTVEINGNTNTINIPGFTPSDLQTVMDIGSTASIITDIDLDTTGSIIYKINGSEVFKSNSGLVTSSIGLKSSSIISSDNGSVNSNNSIVCGGKDNIIDLSNNVLITGQGNTATTSVGSFLTAGFNNIDTSNWSTISGGTGNSINSSHRSVIFGGLTNTIDGSFRSVILSGVNNLIDFGSTKSAIFIGEDNNVTGTSDSSIIGGGFSHLITFSNNSILMGGYDNLLSNADWCGIIGGHNNTISSQSSCFIGGGTGNDVTQHRSGIIGGENNSVSGSRSVVIGGNSHTLSGVRSVILGGSAINGIEDNTVYVPILQVTKSIRFDGYGTHHKMGYLSIGAWNMDVNGIVSIFHGLSATEWKTIHGVTVMIRNDVDSFRGQLDFQAHSNSGVNSTYIVLSRVALDYFDNPAFSSIGVNRGYITFWYTPD